MIEPLLQFGGTFILAYSLIELIKFIVTRYTNIPKNSNGKTQQDIDIAVIKEKLEFIENNHLHSIKERLDKIELEQKKMCDNILRVLVKLGVN